MSENNKNIEESLDKQAKSEQSTAKKLKEFVEAIVIAVILALIIRTFIFQPYFIPSASMEPFLETGDRIIVSKFIYRFTEPKRGDIVVFKYPVDPSRDFVKRVIGLGGETVEIRESKLYVNNKLVEEPYLPDDLYFADYGPVEVPKNSYLMLGDNRNNSEDSRFWGFLDEDLIIGKTELIYWPLDRIKFINEFEDY